MLKKIIDRLFQFVKAVPYTTDEILTITNIGKNSENSNTWSTDNLHVSKVTFSDLYENCQK